MNLANKITALRILLIPLFLYFVYTDLKYHILIATIIFVFAALTDSLDGYIARSRNQVTKFGKFIDPLADKLMITAALLSLVELERIEGWIVMVIIARELIITGLRAVAASDGVVIAASMWGKVKTVTQIVAVVSALLAIPYYNIFVIIALISTILSGVDYIYKNRKILNADK
ncbi:CDP-diacylglycerol--glycerol-3-phosphate 3-phosphatidyltransferase [Clostridium cylindrosporum]|uniref:CDP-diacylglycerol--glycerol-3-phosphate 3-phosphatidyltransferase n=1 Tax=Clostridium cylindrosporum DSM 605 TaxID=1121307 RepID=A0A0J8DFP6_CLOCY|nr:CDP-diacylglycerol--glycerol-3-phosphate 3-phosphatidyltransferase [Clostridium cylindrosporum]KMT23049.1 CDP-diacylglycerol--glycerol-3-phosphate 3-phosphatidyltransferase PgsA [Clostridium cylindrosporum DSM 605]